MEKCVSSMDSEIKSSVEFIKELKLELSRSEWNVLRLGAVGTG
jgi:hypothetical protein